MIRIDEVQSEVVADTGTAAGGAESRRSPEVLKEELRGVVRELLREELERYLRTEVRQQ